MPKKIAASTISLKQQLISAYSNFTADSGYAVSYGPIIKDPYIELSIVDKSLGLEAQEMTAVELVRKMLGHTTSQVYLQGEPGSGKSTVCRHLASQWAKCEDDALFSQFDFVILLPLQNLTTFNYPKDCIQISDVIMKELLGKVEMPEQTGIREMLNSLADNKKVLWLLDGYDQLEVESRNIREFFSLMVNQPFFMLTSSSPDYSGKSYDLNLSILGVTHREAIKYIRAQFSSDKDPALTSAETDQIIKDLSPAAEKAEEVKLIEYLCDHPELSPLMRAPSSLKLICMAWRHNDEKAKISSASCSMDLYESLVKRFIEASFESSGSIVKPGHVMSILRLLAFIDALDNDHVIEFKKIATVFTCYAGDDLKEIGLSEFIRQLIAINIFRSQHYIDSPIVKISFINSQIRDYLAAKFWADNFISAHFDESQEKINLISLNFDLNRINPEWRLIWRFVCAILVNNANPIFLNLFIDLLISPSNTISPSPYEKMMILECYDQIWSYPAGDSYSKNRVIHCVRELIRGIIRNKNSIYFAKYFQLPSIQHIVKLILCDLYPIKDEAHLFEFVEILNKIIAPDVEVLDAIILPSLHDSQIHVKLAALQYFISSEIHHALIIRQCIYLLHSPDNGIRIRSLAMIALSRFMSKSYILTMLIRFLESKDLFLRLQAAEIFIKHPEVNYEALKSTLTILKESEDEFIHDRAMYVLEGLEHPTSAVKTILLEEVQNECWMVRQQVIKLLSRYFKVDIALALVLLKALSDKTWFVRYQAAEAVISLSEADTETVAILQERLVEQAWFVQRQIAEALLSLPYKPAIMVLHLALQNRESSNQRRQAIESFAKLKQLTPEGFSALQTALNDDDEFVRKKAIAILIKLIRSNPASSSVLCESLKTVDMRLQLYFIEVLITCAHLNSDLVHILKEALNSADLQLRNHAVNIFNIIPELADELMVILKDALSSSEWSIRLAAIKMFGRSLKDIDSLIKISTAMLNDPNDHVKLKAAELLIEHSVPCPEIEAILNALKINKITYFLASSTRTIESLTSSCPEAISLLIDNLDSKNSVNRDRAAQLLIKLAETKPVLRSKLVGYAAKGIRELYQYAANYYLFSAEVTDLFNAKLILNIFTSIKFIAEDMVVIYRERLHSWPCSVLQQRRLLNDFQEISGLTPYGKMFTSMIVAVSPCYLGYKMISVTFCLFLDTNVRVSSIYLVGKSFNDWKIENSWKLIHHKEKIGLYYLNFLALPGDYEFKYIATYGDKLEWMPSGPPDSSNLKVSVKRSTVIVSYSCESAHEVGYVKCTNNTSERVILENISSDRLGFYSHSFSKSFDQFRFFKRPAVHAREEWYPNPEVLGPSGNVIISTLC